MDAVNPNWLFRNYFDQRGYYEKTEYEKKPDQYVKEIGQRLFLLDKKMKLSDGWNRASKKGKR